MAEGQRLQRIFPGRTHRCPLVRQNRAIHRRSDRIPGQPFSYWSLAKLRDYLIASGYVTTINVETVRQILHERRVSWQATETWKASTDPDFTTKMRRILDLYDHPPSGGRVLCVDELGPLNLQPFPGRAWRPQGHPVRLRATYTRDHGVRHMIAALDLATGRLHYRIRDRKRWREFLNFLKTLCARWPDHKLYLICDNFFPHKHPEVRAWCAANQVEQVFLRTYSSWLNWIEAEFAAVRYFALNGTGHRTHVEQETAIGAYIRWRNKPAQANSGSRPAPRSATQITRSRLHDEALAVMIVDDWKRLRTSMRCAATGGVWVDGLGHHGVAGIG